MDWEATWSFSSLPNFPIVNLTVRKDGKRRKERNGSARSRSFHCLFLSPFSFPSFHPHSPSLYGQGISTSEITPDPKGTIRMKIGEREGGKTSVQDKETDNGLVPNLPPFPSSSLTPHCRIAWTERRSPFTNYSLSLLYLIRSTPSVKTLRMNGVEIREGRPGK